jgi:hypothetical protein
MQTSAAENRTAIQDKYGSVARSVTNSSAAACCDPGLRCCDPITNNLYGTSETSLVPENAVLASLGCGNPTALIDLKPGEIVLDLGSGGRFAVSDVVTRGEVHEAVRQSMLLWVGCIAGALTEDDYRSKLTAAGFTDVTLEPTRVYNIEDARHFLTEAGVAVDEIAPQVEGKFLSAFIRATKPCCAPGCC